MNKRRINNNVSGAIWFLFKTLLNKMTECYLQRLLQNGYVLFACDDGCIIGIVKKTWF